MKTFKRIILIVLLILLFVGAILMDPLVRFVLALRMERFSDADAVYAGRINGSSPRLKTEADSQLTEYVAKQLQLYYDRGMPYDQTRRILSSLAETGLPQQEIDAAIRAADEMEKARQNLIQADGLYAAGDYGRAIPLFRQALIADESAGFRLEESKIRYKNGILDRAEAQMDAGEYEAAEDLLLDSIDVLKTGDADLAVALEDARRLKAGEIYNARTQEARRLLNTEGPDAAFGYVAELLRETPDSYELMFLDQILRHEYEEDICARAQSLRETGDPVGACSLLSQAMLCLDSERIKVQYAKTRADITFWLVDQTILWEDTANPKTGADSTIARDLSLTDSLSNEYKHSFWADTGSVCFAVEKDYSVFAGTVAFPMGEKSDIYRASATLQIYADGNLIAEFKNIEGASAPIPFSLPVAGIRELTLQWTSEGADGWKDWGRFATVYDGRFLIEPTEP